MKSGYQKAIETMAGNDVDTIRRSTITELRQKVEARHKAPLKFVSHFPFIGRGNVLRDRLVSHEEVNNRLDRALSRH